ncbi:TRAFAC clade GTPase domain-containing protein, partial [Actinocorallia lasiicapitis]
LLPVGKFRDHGAWITRNCFTAPPLTPFVGWLAGVLLWSGLALGALIAATAVLAVGALQAALWLVLAGLAFVLLMALRGIDTVRLKIKGIGLTCPSCQNKVGYPAYSCPEPSCGRRHLDVRPGRYGLINRKCYCGASMRTLLMLGSHNMVAHCPHCAKELAESVGTVPEVVLPVVGGSSSGKTRLMLALVQALDERGGSEVKFADEPSRSAYEKFAPALKSGADTWKTALAGDAPVRAYSFYLTAGGITRLLHVFDPAGEIFESAERMQTQRFMGIARTFVYTLDQLSVEPVWNSLEVPQRARFRKIRAERAPELMFAQVLSGIEEQGVNPKKARLAVALTKQDLVRDVVPEGGSDAIKAWLESPEIGLDNMVRTMGKAFADVRFFRTSSRVEDGLDPAITDLTQWILNGEGYKL